MKKYVLLSLLILAAVASRAHDRYLTHTGEIRSFSQEKMEAVSRNNPTSFVWCALGSQYEPNSGSRWRVFSRMATPSVPIRESRFRIIRRNKMEPQQNPRKWVLLATVQPTFVSPLRFPH